MEVCPLHTSILLCILLFRVLFQLLACFLQPFFQLLQGLPIGVLQDIEMRLNQGAETGTIYRRFLFQIQQFAVDGPAFCNASLMIRSAFFSAS